MLNPEVLSTIILNHRKAAGLSRIELAEMAGVGKTVIFGIEKGKANVQLSTLLKILKVLNIRVKLESPLMNYNSGLYENS
jgi:transcriptional regulator with XRE-family HTH domain